MRVVALYVSPGHNFFGHFGRAPGTHETIAVREVECVAGRGLRGDRFFDFKPDYKGQITFFAEEIYQALCAALDVHDKPRAVFRRNVITRGADLDALIGEKFSVQGVEFLGVSECSPCLWMNEAFAPGAEDFLKGRGGLRARILTDGVLRVSE
jgi:MOSC domain-containing protein YiiM